MIRGAHQASLLAALSNASSYKAATYTTNKDGAANNAIAQSLMQEFIEHVDEHYISQQRSRDSYGRKITYDHWLEGCKKEPHTATEPYHTKPGFMGNWFEKVANLPNHFFSEHNNRSRGLPSMVTEYLWKFRVSAENEQPVRMHEEDTEHVANSLKRILRKAKFPLEIPESVLEYTYAIEASFWREAHNYWAGRKGDADLPN